MTIEPYAVRYSIGTRVVPPKPDTTPPRPTVSYEQDAANIRARFRSGHNCMGQMKASEYNQAKAAEAALRMTRDRGEIMEALRVHGPLMAKGLAAITGLHMDRISKILRALSAEGRAVSQKKSGKNWWTATGR